MKDPQKLVSKKKIPTSETDNAYFSVKISLKKKHGKQTQRQKASN